MSLRQTIDDQIKDAMKAHDQLRLDTVRMLKSAVKYREIEQGQPLDDAGVAGVVNSLIKQRRDSVEQYRAGNRPDAAAKEETEIRVLQSFLPEPLAAEELSRLVDEAVTQSGAQGPKDMGAVMKLLKERVAGRADGKTLSDLVKDRLSRR